MGLPLCIYSCSRNLPVQVGLCLKQCLCPQFMGVLWSHQPRTPLSWPGALQGSPRVLGGPEDGRGGGDGGGHSGLGCQRSAADAPDSLCNSLAASSPPYMLNL